jgi:hypothetical protein
MFSDHQLKWRVIIMIGAFVAAVAWFAVLLIAGARLSLVIPSFTKFGAVLLLSWGAWQLFTKTAWRWKPLRYRGWLVTTPNLTGRWVGVTISSYDKKKRNMTLEITQTLLTLRCVAFGSDNVARIYSARLLSDQDDRMFQLTYLYHAKRQVATSVPGDEHEGVVILDLADTSPRRLDGFYVNDRDPRPTKGEIHLVWESSTLKGRL